MVLYLADFSRTPGAKDKKPRKRDYIVPEVAKASAIAGGIGLTAQGLGMAANKLGNKGWEAIKYREKHFDPKTGYYQRPREAEQRFKISMGERMDLEPLPPTKQQQMWDAMDDIQENKHSSKVYNFIKNNTDFNNTTEIDNHFKKWGKKWGLKAGGAALAVGGTFGVLRSLKKYNSSKKQQKK